LTAPALRLALPYLLPGMNWEYCTLTRLDTIAVGCCLAYAARWPALWRVARWPGWLVYGSALVLALAIGAGVLLSELRPGFGFWVGKPFVAICFAATIWLWCNHSQRWLGRVLNCAPVVWVGLLSYSLYLWQQPFIGTQMDEAWTRPPWDILGFILLAHLSYLAVERPMLRLKDRLAANGVPAPRPSPSAKPA
jgi:peptidoglycan/LPS O-acetylase OafA/YrhL